MNKKSIMKTAHRLTRNIVKKGQGYRRIFSFMLKHVHMMNKLRYGKIKTSVRLFKHINTKSGVKTLMEGDCSPIKAFNYINSKYMVLSNTPEAFITYSIQEQW